MFPKTTVSTLLSVIIFTGRPFPHPTFTGARGAPNGIRGITIHITEPKIHISYSENHDSTLFFYYFYMSPLPTLAHTIAKGSTFSISSRFDVTKLQQNCFDVSSTGSFPFPMSMYTHIIIPYHPYGNMDSLNLDSNGIEGVIIHLSVPENYGCDTIISIYFYKSPCWPRSV